MPVTYRNYHPESRQAHTWQSLSAMRGHVSPVTSIAQGKGPDADVVSGGYDGYVLCWDHEITEPRWAVRFGDLVNAVIIDDAQRHIAAAVADGFVYVLDVATGYIQHRLGPHADDVNDVAWDPRDPDKFAVVCDAGDTNVYVWDISTRDPTRVVMGHHDHGVFAIAYSPSGKFLASASEDCTVRIWDTRNRAEIAVLSHPGDVETVAWSPDGQILATGCDDGRVRLWRRTEADWAVGAQLAEATASIRCVRFSPTGRYIAAGSYDGTIRLHRADSGWQVQNWSGSHQWERACLLPDDGSVLVGSFGDRPVRYPITAETTGTTAVNAARTSPVTVSARPTWGVNALAIDENSGVVLATDCGVVTGLDAESPALTVETLVTCVAVEPGGTDVAVTDYLGRAYVIESGRPRQVAATAGGPLNAVAWVNGTLVTGGYDGILRQWELNGTQIAEIVAHRAPVKSVVWSLASRCVVTGSSDDTVASWRADDGCFTLVARLADPQLVLVNSVAVPVARPWVVIGSRDRSIRLWLPDGSRQCSVLPLVHDKSVKTVDVHRRGDLIVSGSYDGTLCFWHLDDEDNLIGWRQERLHGKPGVSKVAIGEDAVYSAGWNGTVAQWSLNGELLAHFFPSVDG